MIRNLILALAIAVALICCAVLLWWDTSEGARFNRAEQDLRELTPNKVSDARYRYFHDPWGRNYRSAKVISDNQEFVYVFSLGPDGMSLTLGRDADDLTCQTNRGAWMEGRHPIRSVESILLIAVSISGTLLITKLKRNSIIKQAEQVSESNAR
jgi:hypothetical protein